MGKDFSMFGTSIFSCGMAVGESVRQVSGERHGEGQNTTSKATATIAGTAGIGTGSEVI
jgi:hypothetical protein